MADEIASDSKQKFIYASFNKISANALIVIKNQDDKKITAFKTERDISNLLYGSSDLDYKSYKIYTGGEIDGEEITYGNININTPKSNNNDISNNLLKVLIGEISLLIVFFNNLYNKK